VVMHGDNLIVLNTHDTPLGERFDGSPVTEGCKHTPAARGHMDYHTRLAIQNYTHNKYLFLNEMFRYI